MIRRLIVAVLLLQSLVMVPAALAASTSRPAASPCQSRVLVLGSLPAEIDPVLAAAHLDSAQPVTKSDRHFFLGTLAGTKVVMGMVGIGLINATQTARAAFAGFRCGDRTAISALVYTGVAGAGQGTRIGDVAVPSRWTLTNGKSWMATDPRLLSATAQIVQRHQVRLDRTTPLGAPGCACQNPDLVRTVTFPYQPRVVVGGSGQSYDNFNGKAFPCVPGGGDIFGCEPCPNVLGSAADAPRAVSDMYNVANLQFILSNLGPAASPSEVNYEASDNETAAADLVAHQNGVPFIAFRAASDGTPDPLGLPGYPSQFLVYYQLAADNAAHSAIALVANWPLSG